MATIILTSGTSVQVPVYSSITFEAWGAGGSGGSFGAAPGIAGVAGGPTTIPALGITANGGAGGTTNGTTSSGGAASGGNVSNIAGNPGGAGMPEGAGSPTTTSGAGGSAPNGGAGGAAASVPAAPPGNGTTKPGNPGTAPGGGGSGYAGNNALVPDHMSEGGGASGAYVRSDYTLANGPAAGSDLAYTIGTGGVGSGSFPGGAGGGGQIVITYTPLYNLTATSLATGSPVLGTPVLALFSSTLTPVNLTTGSPALGRPRAGPEIDSATVLLLHFDFPRTGIGFPDTSGKNHVVTRVLNAQTNTAQAVFGASSLFLDGSVGSSTATSLALDGSSDFAFGAGDFTIEMWVRFAAAPSANVILYDSRPDGQSSYVMPLWFMTPTPTLVYYVNGVTVIQGTAVLAANTWYHIAITRAGTATKMFVNGVQDGPTYTDTNNYINGAGAPVIGANAKANVANFTGYIDEVRVSKGIARWTGNFPVPTAPWGGYTPSGPVDANTLLLLHCDGANASTSFPDASPNNCTVTANGTAHVENGGAQSLTFQVAAFLDGSATGRLTVAPQSLFNFGAGDWTIDFYLFVTAMPVTAAELVCKVNFGGYGPFQIAMGNTGVITFYGTTTGSSWDVVGSVGTVVANSFWHHIAVVRKGNTFTGYLDGVANTPVTSSITLLANALALAIGGSADGGGYALTGYMDEIRISNVARWIGNFTPPTALYGGYPLVATSLAPASPVFGTPRYTPDIDSATVLLLHGDGANASIAFPDSSVRQHAVTRTGNAQIATAQSQFGGASGFFDGSASTYLALDGSSDFAFGTGDFTIDFWMRPTSLASAVIVWDGRVPSVPSATPVLFISAPGPPVTLLYSVNNVTQIGGTTVLAINTWYHVAVVRASGTTRMFVNGVQDGPAYADANNYIVNPSTPGIGGNVGTAASTFVGYLDEIRVTKGLARWTGNFTPPAHAFDVYGLNPLSLTTGSPVLGAPVLISGVTGILVATEDTDTAAFVGIVVFPDVTGILAATEAPDTALFNGAVGAITGTLAATEAADTALFNGTVLWDDPNTILLLHCDGANGSASFIDSSHSHCTLTPTNATISTAQAKFAQSASLAAGYLQVTSADIFNPGAADFTIDFWINIPAFTANYWILTKITQSNFGPFTIVCNQTTGTLALYLSSTGTSWDIANNVVTSAGLTVNAWNHVALVRNGSNFTLYINGVSRATATSALALFSNSIPLTIGAGSAGFQPTTAFYDEFRVSNIARWTANFTPPGVPYGTVAAGSLAATEAADTALFLPAPSVDGDANTILLLHCDGANGSASFADQSGWTPANTVTPAGVTVSTAQAKFNQAAVSAGAAGAHLSVSPAANFNFGSSSFTIDFWVRLAATPTTPLALVTRAPGGNYGSYNFYVSGANLTVYLSSTATSWNIGNISAGNLSLNTWYHVALVRNGNTFTLYLNGVSVGTPISSALALFASATPLSILGGSDGADNGSQTTYVDEFRVSNIARWTANFTPPTAPYAPPQPTGTLAATEGPDTAAFVGTALFLPVTGPLAAIEAADVAAFIQAPDANTILLLHCDGTDGSPIFTDSSGYAIPNTITPSSGFAVSSAQTKFAQSGFNSGASGARLSVTPASNFNFGAGDFTVDFWYRLGAQPSASSIFVVGQAPSNSFGPFVFYIGGGSTGIAVYLSTTGTGWTQGPFGGATLTLNTWYHLALVRHGNTFTVYVNGISTGSVTVAGALNFTSNPLSITGATDGGISNGSVPSYIDEFRVSNVARWTSNFTPPGGPYPLGVAPSGTLAATDASDTAAFVGTVITVSTGTLAATEAPDTAAFVGTIVIPDVIGALAAIEDTDTALLVGTVTTTGILAASEAADTVLFVGDVTTISTGTLAAAEVPDSALFVGALIASGTLAAVEASDAALLAGGVFTDVTGQLAAIEDTDTAAFAGSGVASGTLDAIEADDTASFVGDLATIWRGTLAATDAPDTSIIYGTVIWTGILAAVEALPDTAAFTGVAGWGSVLAATEAADSATFTGAAEIFGAFDATEIRDTAAFAVGLSWSVVLNATDAPDDADFSAIPSDFGPLIAVEAPDSAAFAGFLEWDAVLAATDAADSAAFAGQVASAAILDVTEAPDIVAFFGIQGWTGTFALDEDPDVATFAGNVAWLATLAAIEAADSAAFSGSVAYADVSGTLAAIEVADSAAFFAGVVASGTLVATDGDDTAALTGDVAWDAVLAVTENTDTASFTATTQWNAFLAAMEAPDAILVSGIVGWDAIIVATEGADTARFRPFAPVLSVPEIEHINGRAWAPTINGRMWVEKINGREAIT